jgi:hypothetical protein
MVKRAAQTALCCDRVRRACCAPRSERAHVLSVCAGGAREGEEAVRRPREADEDECAREQKQHHDGQVRDVAQDDVLTATCGQVKRKSYVRARE